MKLSYKIMILLLLPMLASAEIAKPWTQVLDSLSPEELYVIVDKGTERPFSGKYVNTDSRGLYRCKVCKAALYQSTDKFASDCGWPSFDDAIPAAVKQQKDADGRRTEIVCSRCGAHLGHLFEGEGLTVKNRRYCVNSITLDFDKGKTIVAPQYKSAYFAGGCFWGVEYHLEKLEGVKEVNSGFMGGTVAHPSYYQVIKSKTGHLETVEVIYDPKMITYKKLAKAFFEIHDPTQKDGQGPDIGEQYRSAIFVANSKEQRTIEKLIALLRERGYKVVTKILPQKPFYQAENSHQDYYEKKGKQPYCHTYIKRFE